MPALKQVIGDRSLEIHTHCLTGLAPLVCLEAVELGADALHLSIAPLADGNAQPPRRTSCAICGRWATRSTSTTERIDDDQRRI